MKKQYEILSKASDGTWFHREYKVFDSDEQAHKYAESVSLRTKFEHRAQYLRKLTEDVSLETNPVVELDSEEVKDSKKSEDEVVEDNPSTENEKEVDESKQLDNIEWKDSHDTDNFPRGWWLNKEFVAKDGTVFNKKKEVPHLYRTLEPSDY